MKRTFFHSLFAIFLLLFATFLYNACADSDDYIYDGETLAEITMYAQMARSFDSTDVKKKADTISVGDSMIFTATINPSKSVRIKNSYWEMDGSFYASEFSVRDAITFPGKHEFVFVLVDFFGDTLRDTVHLWVGTPPILKTNNFIPASKSQGLPSNTEIQFAWQAYDPDSLLTLHYHFTLANVLDKQELEADIFDTILTEPYFICNKELEPLSIYQWSVRAYNEYGQASAKEISGEFSTKGIKDEAGIYGVLSPSALNLFANIDLIVLDSIGKPTGYTTTMEKTPITSIFSIHPLPPGKYRITARYPKGPDYFGDTLPIKLVAGEIAHLDTLHLTDKTPPTIKSITDTDTIDFADTLSFIIEDGGGSNTIQSTTITLGNREITSYKENNGIISFATTSDDSAWITQLLTIKAKDASGNTRTKDFYVRPVKNWIETNHDTTISTQSSIEIFVKDINPYGFKPESFFISPFGDVKGTVTSPIDSADKEFRHTVNGESFNQNVQKITVGVTYENGIVQTREWTLTLNMPPSLPSSSRITPRDIIAGKSVELEWNKATDEENDSLLYRIGYTLTKDETDTSLYIYPNHFFKDTTVTLVNLPVGEIYWWVQAIDSYGGISDIWENKGHITIQDSDKEKNGIDYIDLNNLEGGNEE